MSRLEALKKYRFSRIFRLLPTMQRRRLFIETSLLLIVSIITWVKIIEGCVVPQKGLKFGDLAQRADVVVEATPTPNQLKKLRRYAAVFRVTRTFTSKNGILKVGGLFLSGTFGTTKECTRPIPGKKYIMFLQSVTRSVRGRPVYRVRYNPVPSSVRNIQFFNSVLSGKRKGKGVLSSGCRKMPVPPNSKLSCSPGNDKCRIACNKNFKYTAGRKFRTCNSATGLWSPAKVAKCVKSQKTTTAKGFPTKSSKPPIKTKTRPRNTKGKRAANDTNTKLGPGKYSDDSEKSILPPRRTIPPEDNAPTSISPVPSAYEKQNSTATDTPSTKSLHAATQTTSRSVSNAAVTSSAMTTYQNGTQRNAYANLPRSLLPTPTTQSTATIALSTDHTSLMTKRTSLITDRTSLITSPIASTTTAKTRKPRPKLPIYKPLKPLYSRPIFVPYRRRQYDSSIRNPTNEAEDESRDSTHRPVRPPLPVYKPLAPMQNRWQFAFRRVAPTPVQDVAILKVATPAEIIGEEIENVDDKFAIARIGDVWKTDDGLTYKPEVAVNKTVYGCPYYEANMTVFGSWQGGFNAMVKFEKLSKSILAGWMVRVEFSFPIIDIETHVVNFYLGTEDGRVVTFTPKPYMEVLHINQDLTVAFVARTESSEVFAPSAKGFLLSKCTDEEITGRAVGSMFQGKTVVDGYGPDSRSHKIPHVPTTESPTTVSTTTTTTTTSTTTTERSLPQRAFDELRAPGRIRAAVEPRTPLQNRQLSHAGSANTSLPRNWLASRCSADVPNGVLPIGGSTKPNWRKSKDETKYDYNEILHKSGLFYMAQKSGKLPQRFPVPWRGYSALKDGCTSGHNLFGGLYNGGGHEKSTIAIAFTITMLAWGAIDYKAAYTESGEYDNVVKLIKVNSRYLIRCHTAKEELVVQVGNHESAGTSWKRPEEIMTDGRTIHKITPRKPGQDVAAETAAALAAASILLKSSDAKLSQQCLKHAKEIDDFARKYPGPYSRSIPKNVNNYHTLSTTLDNLAWSVLWLGKATNNQAYYKRAQVLYSKLISRKVDKFDWSEKTHAIPILLTKFAKMENYNWRGRKVINSYREKAAQSGNRKLWLGSRGANVLSANAAFLALQVAQLNKGKAYASAARKFAEEQLHLLLGDSGRSFVVGFGKDYPKRPRHMASSCADFPATCDSSVLRTSTDNPHVLYGALVGGPGENGKYKDLITSTLDNEVAIDFNAGFQSAIAGLKQSKMSGQSTST